MSESIRKIKTIIAESGPEPVVLAPDRGEIVSEDKLPAPSGSDLFFGSIAKLACWLAVLLLPLAFYNISDPLGLAKQFLLLIAALAALGAWGAKVVSAGHIAWRRGRILQPLGLLAGLALLSSWFSDSSWVSFLGDSGRFSSAGATLLAYFAIFFVAFQVFDRRDAKIAALLWLAASCLAAVFALAQMFGWFIFPAAEYKSRFFNSIGSIFSLQVFVLASVPFLTAVICGARSKWLKFAALAMILIQLAVALVADFWAGWASLGLAALALFLINFGKTAGRQSPPANASGGVLGNREYQKTILFPLALVTLSAALWLVDIPPMGAPEAPGEISPSYGASWDIMKSSWKENPVFGSGLETFPYVYARFKSPVLNQTNFWGVNFNDAIAEVLTWGTTTGILGSIAWLAFVFVFLWFAWRCLKDCSVWAAGIFSSWIYALAAQALYPSSLPLAFLFWFLPALFIILAKPKSAKQFRLYYFKAGSFKTLGIFLSLLAAVLISVVGGFYAIKRMAAERTFTSALLLPAAAPAGRDEVIDGISRAIAANPRELRYYRVLTQVLFQKMNDIMTAVQNRPEAERQATAEESAQLQNLVVRAVDIIQNTLTLDPQNVGVLSDAAAAFLNLTSLVAGADDLAIQHYERAVALEPINPFLKTQLGQLYLAKSNLFNGGQTGPNFDQSYLDKSRASLEAALTMNPNYANARYFWALIIDSDGRQQEALNSFLYLQQTNPDNKLLPAIVANLKAGRPALGVPPQAAVPPASPAAESTQGIPPAEGQGATAAPEPAPAR